MNDPLNEVQKREVNAMIMDVVSQQHSAQQRELAESRTTLERLQNDLKETTEAEFGVTEATIKAHESKLKDMTTAMKAFEAQRNDTGNQLDAKFAGLQELLEKVEAQTSLSEAHIADQLGAWKTGIMAEAKNLTDKAERHVSAVVANTSEKFNQNQGKLDASIDTLTMIGKQTAELNGRLAYIE